MDPLTSVPFLSARPLPGPEAKKAPALLARFLPPVPDGIARAWLLAQPPPPGWLLDPFGAAPSFAVEAASMGWRVLVAANNPVTRFLIELAAAPPSLGDFQAALAELSAARKGEERLEQHILSLYETECAICRQLVSAEAFIWDSRSGSITERVYTCPHCGDSGEREATPADVERAARFAASDLLHRSRALSRVAPPGDPDRPNAEEALQLYMPRAVYALGTLINRLDQLTLPPARRRALYALLLQACDSASALWSHGPERARPRSLQLPTSFLEQNVWKAMESSLAALGPASPPKDLPSEGASRSLPDAARPSRGAPQEGVKEGGRATLTVWPELPPEGGGLCIFEGALRDMKEKVGLPAFEAALGVLPRPNQAFWTLSALWAGWLWGREAAAPFKGVLRRRRYDWPWHAEALRAAGVNLADLLGPGKPFFALLAEAEPAFISASLAAMGDAGFLLQAVAMRSADDPLQLHWQAGEGASPSARSREDGSGHPSKSGFDESVLRPALKNLMAGRAEPIFYLTAYLAGAAALAAADALPLTSDLQAETATAIQQALEDPAFRRYKERASEESGLWGLAEPGEDFISLTDRVEMAVVRYLQGHPGCQQEALHAYLYQHFPGLLTPSLALSMAVLDSYAVQNGGWWLREEDTPTLRRAEIGDMQGVLEQLGERLDYHSLSQEGGLVVWEDGLETELAFFVQGSAVMERVLHANKYPPEKTVLVLPGGRAGLLAYKLRRDPYLQEMTAGWRFLKFRHLRLLNEAALLSRETWEEQLDSDPIEQASGQMVLF